MSTRLRPIDITNYALNELDPRERIYVESMMLACEASRRDALEMIEMARMLEEGMRVEEDSSVLTLDVARRDAVFAANSNDSVWIRVGRIAVAAASMAACVAFSVAAPQMLRFAIQPVAQQNSQQQGDAVRSLAELDSWAAVLQAASDAAFGMADDLDGAASAVEEFPTRILMPKGTVGILDMPMPGLGSSESN